MSMQLRIEKIGCENFDPQHCQNKCLVARVPFAFVDLIMSNGNWRQAEA